jgi:hypothetical protein
MEIGQKIRVSYKNNVGDRILYGTITELTEVSVKVKPFIDDDYVCIIPLSRIDEIVEL